MTEVLRPDDPEIVEKLFALAPADRQRVLKQITTDWEHDRKWSAAFEWLMLSIRRESAPSDVDLAFLHGKSTERLQWILHQAPATGVTPAILAAERQKSRKALLEKNDARHADNTWRHDEAEGWRSIAREVASRRGKYQTAGGRVEDEINRELEKRGFEPRADSTIRKAIRGEHRPK